MSAKSENVQAPAVEAVLTELKSTLTAAKLKEAQAFTSHLLHRVTDEDLAARPAAQWAAMARDLLEFVRVRKAGTSSVRVFNPTLDEQGYESTHTVIEVVTEDAPFLVDSVSMAVSAAGLLVHAIVHPVYRVERDAGGHVLSLGAEGKGKSESVMHFETSRVAEAEELKRLQHGVARALHDVRAAVADWQVMREKMLQLSRELPQRKLPVDAAGVAEAQEFLNFVANDHFTFLGYREYVVDKANGVDSLVTVPNSGLGILRQDEDAAPRPLNTLVARELPQSGSTDAIILTKTNARATVHRPGYMDYISVLGFNDAGVPVTEQRFLGLFTSGAYMRRPQDVPLVRQKVESVMARSGLKRESHSGKALRHILETLPRDELFQATEDELFATAMGILQLQERTRSRLFVRRDKYGRFFSCLVFIPRDRFDNATRERIEAMLKRVLHGERVDSTVQVGESALARLHLVIRPKAGERARYDIAEIEAKLGQIVRNWSDELRDALVQKHGEDKGLKLANRYGKALPASYIEEVTPHLAVADVEAAAALKTPDDIRLSLYRSRKKGDGLRFKLFRYGAPITLSEALPMLENMGLKILSEHPYEMDLGESTISIQDFDVQPAAACEFDIDEVREAFQNAFERIWRGQAENDGFNKLILGAQMDWRQVSMLRGYCKYLLQTGVPFSQAYMEATLNQYPAIAGLLVELFEAKFDPARESAGKASVEQARKRLAKELDALVPEDVRTSNALAFETLYAARGESREAQAEGIIGVIRVLLDRVASLDEDRILRSFMGVIRATLRTSFYQLDGSKPKDYVSFKFDPAQVPDLPKPKPYREIFVYSPRVEGVHLRFGPVARGGLRWSDRREDFRTEVLGLVKAQMVKNTVIVPVGSKGGFFVKRPPVGGDRDAQLAEGIACYRMFINGLLDITDNIVDGQIVHPRDVVRHDANDPYLVVAADKGTATFSDIANSISADHGFWLGDAFASGGSVGYDHKGMGITAKGGWESVKRHFRALGRDCQSEDFTCVGIGDMSGDVFGNGMLLSRHIRLVAAFDHRHIFLDPNPDAAISFKERTRLFALARSSWADYDTGLVSKGGGVFPRSAKTIPVSAEVRAVLGIEDGVSQLSPNDLMRAILKAPVDLLWNGGIGTYVKAEAETNADAGDRANNAIRINGKELRCKLVGEGGNLGMTQRGRIEASLNGVLLNTDFIDNSAGVDTSDHEVNIKILLGDAVQREELTLDARNVLLADMTDEVERLVLMDNYRQNQAISVMERMSVSRLGAKQHFVRTLEAQGLLDRQIEFLPSDAEFAERKARGLGLTRPELAILLSYSKIVLFQQLLDSDVPEDAYLSRELKRYFPEPLQEKYSAHMERHRLKREIIATAVTNSMINRMGATFVLRMQEDTGQAPAPVAKAYTIAREVLDARELWAQIEALDGKVNGNAQIDALLVIWQLLRNMTRWLLNQPGESLDIAKAVARYQPGMLALKDGLFEVLSPSERAAFDAARERWLGQGFPVELAEQLAGVPALVSALDIIDTAQDNGLEVARVAQVHFALGEALHLKWLMSKVEELPVETRWHAHARGSLRDELYQQHRALAAQVLKGGKGSGTELVEHWLNRDDASLKFTLGMFADMRSQVVTDYPIVSVAVRRLAQLVQAGARRAAGGGRRAAGRRRLR
ncbi:MAG: glutamate dehydrogenase [Lysobacteraceae bacterium SCN 69-25]|nr:MAG: glutamate dehydrogenase [Xanthomonadaceae bacterium SCN 69-25]